MTDTPSVQPSPPAPASAVVQRMPRFQLIWLIPLVAAIVAGYLAWQTIDARGPVVTLTFRTADGLTAGQTKVRHKAVDLGVVESITLAGDLSHVIVKVQMQRAAIAELTDRARFWVVRPRLTGTNISGLDTLVSGAFIELDPGLPAELAGAEQRREFEGLEEPPAIRSDEPGQTFTLRAARIGGIGSGSPVLYRDVTVGEVLRWEFGPQGQDFLVTIFVRRPFDEFVHEGTQFWNSSGLALEVGANGVQLHLDSLQAVLSGAVTFETTVDARATPISKPGAVFRLYRDQDTASAAGYKRRIPFVTRFNTSVRGLAVGASVNVYGITIGTVTDIKLQFDPIGGDSHVDVRFEIQPERILDSGQIDLQSPLEVARNLVKRGLRIQLHTANYLTGQMFLGMDFVPNAAPANVTQLADGTIALPGESGGLDSLTSSATAIAQKLSQIPFEALATDLDGLLRGAGKIANAPELTQSLNSLSQTLNSVQEVVRKFDASAGPAFRRLPEIASSLQATLDRANKLVGSADTGYGGNSQVQRDLERVLSQVSDAARSVRVLADFLTQHPEALIQGRSGKGG